MPVEIPLVCPHNNSHFNMGYSAGSVVAQPVVLWPRRFAGRPFFPISFKYIQAGFLQLSWAQLLPQCSRWQTCYGQSAPQACQTANSGGLSSRFASTFQGSCCCHRTAGVRSAGALGHTSAEISAFVYSHAWIQAVVSVLAGWRLLLEGLHPSHQPAAVPHQCPGDGNGASLGPRRNRLP